MIEITQRWTIDLESAGKLNDLKNWMDSFPKFFGSEISLRPFGLKRVEAMGGCMCKETAPVEKKTQQVHKMLFPMYVIKAGEIRNEIPRRYSPSLFEAAKKIQKGPFQS